MSNISGCNQEDEQYFERDEKTGKPAELFRKDLISAMKIADTVQLADESYYCITDPWRMDWEKGVQVPVLQEQKFKSIKWTKRQSSCKKIKFSMPSKYLHSTQDSYYRKSIHQLYETPDPATASVSRYDVDLLDDIWLRNINRHRSLTGLASIPDEYIEELFEGIEIICQESMQTKIKTVVGLGIEYDENIVCDICRSPDSEDTNEMVFCDKCDVCVHQACYGIQKIPSGSWLCRVCVLGIKPPRCVLCPNTGGAMKTTPSGDSWSHVSCALWVPEVSFGCADKMEPVINIASIPTNRWALMCAICREKNNGACIQCAVRTCNVAFHVTCSIRNHLLMQTVVEYKTDDVRFRAYCAKHTKGLETQPIKPAEGTTVIDNTRDRAKPVVSHELNNEELDLLRSQRLDALAKEFYTCTLPAQLVTTLANSELDVLDPIFSYWRLRRRASQNKTLVAPLDDELDEDTQEEMNLIARVKMFVHLRQDLERVRNLTYMVNRREKLSRQYLHVVCSEFAARRKLWDVKPLPLKRRGRKSDGRIARIPTDDDDDEDDADYNKPLKELSNQTPDNSELDSTGCCKQRPKNEPKVVDSPTNRIPRHVDAPPHPKHLSTKKQRKRRRIEDSIDTFLLSPSKTSTLYDLHESILEQVKLDNQQNENEAARSKQETPVAPRCIKLSSKTRAAAPPIAAVPVVEGATDDADAAALVAAQTPAPPKALTVRKYTQRPKSDVGSATAGVDAMSLPGPAKKIIMDAYERSNVRAAHSKSLKEPQKKKKPDLPIVSTIRQNVQNSISDFFRKSINKK